MSAFQTIIPPSLLSTDTSAAFCVCWTDQRGEHRVEISRPTVFGSSENAQVVVGHPTVSRIHAAAELDEAGWWIRDLGSSNGTFVNRVEVKIARLAVGASVRLGAAELRIEKAQSAAAETNGEELLWHEERFGPLVGRSASMRALFATLARVAATDSPVLVGGETGAGKELVARAIHETSTRSAQPYVIVDCAALSETLLESELFGHARGAFTGAVTSRIGAIESATGGTVFLDEIGELPRALQPKLLRVLEQQTIRRLGESEHRRVDVRFIAATHRDLVEMVARGWFREDLYFRLAVLPVRVPPLRERLEDLELLCEHFLGPDGSSLLTPEFLERVRRHPWRGNVRELRNVISRFRALGMEGDPFAAAAAEPTPLPITSTSQPEATPSVFGVPSELLALSHKDFREQWADLGEKEYLRRKLLAYSRNISRVAREIELARTYTHRLVRKHGL